MVAHDAFWYAFAALAMLSSYLLFAAGLHWLIGVSRLFPADRPGERLATALLFGPVAGAWTFGAALRLFPSMPAAFYLVTCLGIWIGAGIAGRRALMTDVAGYRAALARQRRSRTGRKTTVFLFAALAFGFFRILWLNAQVPPYANDPLEYLTVARLIAGKLALTGIYPPIDTEVTSGFYGPWTHPPGFVLLMSWVHILQGDAFSAGAVKFINAYFLTAGAWLVFVYAGGSLRYRGVIAALLYILTPLLFVQTFEHHVDVSRVALWTGAFLAVVHWARRPTLLSSLVLGLLFGLGNFVHSIGLIALPIFAVLSIIVAMCPIPSRTGQAFIVIVAALAVVAPDLMTNLNSYGRLIGDSVELWNYAPLMVTEHLRYARGIFTPYEVITLGLLSTFTRISLFGITPWLAFGMILPLAMAWSSKRRAPVGNFARRAMRPTVFSVSAFAWLGFFGVTALTVIGGSELIIKNARYALTTVAFTCILTVQAGDQLLRLISRRSLRTKLTLAKVNEAKVDEPQSNGLSTRQWFSYLRRIRSKTHVRVFLVVFLAVCFNAIVHFQTARLLRYANVDAATALQPEQIQAAMSDYPQSRLIARLNRRLADGSWTPRGKVLSFRVGDIAYYSRFGYMSYLDPAALPAFEADSAQRAAEFLSRIGVRYVATPPYSLPEIYNSAVGALLTDPGRTRIVDSDAGFTLYELLESPEQMATVRVATDLPLSVIDSPQTEFSQLRISTPSGASDHNFPSPVGQLDTGSYVRWSRAERAYFAGTALNIQNGEHVFSARMSGSGFVRIALMRQDSTTNVLWEGLVSANERLVATHFDLAELNHGLRKDSKGPEAVYGIGIWLKSGSRVRIHSARLERILGRTSSEVARVNNLSQLLLSGYDFGLNGIAPSRLANLKKIARCQCSMFEIAKEALQFLRTRFGLDRPGFPIEKLEITPFAHGLSVLNLDGRRLSVDFPEWFLPDGELGNQLYPQGRLFSTARLGGAGLREVSLSVQCNQFKIHPADEYRDITVFGRRYVMMDADREYEFEADVPCMVKSARVSVDMWRPPVSFDTPMPPLAYRFGSNRMSFGYTDSGGAWRTSVLLPLAGHQ